MVRPAVIALFAGVVELLAQQPVDFTTDVRPLLSDRCFACHGPDARQRRGGLRLDRRQDALAELPSGTVPIVPGAPDRSELLRRVTAPFDDDDHMPPRDSKLSLSAAEIDVLRRWIAAGAPYAGHWAFAPLPAEVEVPTVARPDLVTNAIDAFVQQRLAAAALMPSKPADRATWLRRVSLSLTGLPPADSELDAFERDRGDGAVGRAVDRLLASPRYGERMASDWLDVARYADTFGYQSDVERPVWPWRDWVVRAFNDNLPYDRFATWQIAGDMLPDATREQVVATAFQRLHRQTNEGGSVEEEMRLEYVADRTETFATAFLGLTVGCARCHDHKYDPIPTRDYYALSAFFDDIDESGLYSHFTRATPTPALSLPSEAQQAQEVLAEARVRELEAELAAVAAAPNVHAALWAVSKDGQPMAEVGRFSFESLAGDRLDNSRDATMTGKVGEGPVLVDGPRGRAIRFDGENWATFPGVADFDRHQPFSIAFWLRVPEAYERAVVLHRSKAWTDAGSRGYELLIEQGQLSFALVHFWPGNAIRVRTTEPFPIDRWTHVALTYDGSSRAAGMTVHIDGRPAAQRVVRDALTRTIQGGGADALTLAQRFRDRGLKGGAVDELMVFGRELSAIEVAGLAGHEALPSPRDLRLHYLGAIDRSFGQRLDELRDARRALGQIRDAQAEIMVMRQTAQPRATYVRPRGSYLEQGEQVEPETPTCLPPLPDVARRDRLALAHWLTDPDHPLTARVAVNRIWQMHFGTGLVETAEDFGSQGTPPTHPQLLDWLARRFVDSGWDLKGLHRLIVTSTTYRQSSAASAALRERDPENRLLARGPRLQLSAEMIRDQALWASGLLVERLGGPPVKPYQPAGLWREKSGQVYQPDTGDGLYRRSLYTYWKRTSPPPAMLTLDAAKRDVCVVRRQHTATPLQALVLLNDPQHVEAARVFAEALLAEAVDDAGDDAGHDARDDDAGDAIRIEAAFRRLTSRRPHASEREILRGALFDARATFREQPERARALLAVGERPPRTGLDVAEVAAWTMVVSVLQNFDEVVTRR